MNTGRIDAKFCLKLILKGNPKNVGNLNEYRKNIHNLALKMKRVKLIYRIKHFFRWQQISLFHFEKLFSSFSMQWAQCVACLLSSTKMVERNKWKEIYLHVNQMEPHCFSLCLCALLFIEINSKRFGITNVAKKLRCLISLWQNGFRHTLWNIKLSIHKNETSCMFWNWNEQNLKLKLFIVHLSDWIQNILCVNKGGATVARYHNKIKPALLSASECAYSVYYFIWSCSNLN